jgi:hypothetical protein
LADPASVEVVQLPYVSGRESRSEQQRQLRWIERNGVDAGYVNPISRSGRVWLFAHAVIVSRTADNLLG